MSKYIIKNIIKEQVDIINQIRNFDKKFPWFRDVVETLSSRIEKTNTQVSTEDLGDGIYKIEFTGPPGVLRAVLLGMKGRELDSDHIKPKNPWNDSTLVVFLEAKSEAEEKL